MEKVKGKSYIEDLQVSPEQKDYDVRIRKPSYWWIWPLIIIAFLLLCCIRCSHTITVETLDSTTGQTLVSDSVQIKYTAHYLIKNGVLTSEDIVRTQAPDQNGKVVFQGLPCSVFSYIFYAGSNADYEVYTDCYDMDPKPQKRNFHYKKSHTLYLSEKLTRLFLTVTDRETDEPLAAASVLYSFTRRGQNVADSVKTDADGRCEITDAPLCGTLKLDKVSCYAYKDTTDVMIPVLEALNEDTLTIVQLTPVKESFTFFVKDKYSKEPVPEAKVEIVLKDRNNVVRHGPVTTNVDGTGRGAYQDAFIAATLQLKASKKGYRDGEYTPVCTVDEFRKKPDSLRVIYLEPLPQAYNFVNKDSITKKPVAGVKNHIVIQSVDGKEYVSDEISNKNGVFTVNARKGDKIAVHSEKEPEYEPKDTSIPNFQEKGETIFMKPRVTDLTFRTIVHGTANLLPDCTLRIIDGNGNSYQPTNSGNGEFTVKNVPIGAILYIVASKPRYADNDYTIDGKKVSYLMQAPQKDRDIPLVEGLEPCNASNSGASNVAAGTVSKPVSYNMGANSGTFTISWNNGNALPDKIDIYNHKPGENYKNGFIWTTGMVYGESSATVSFNKGSVITIVVTTGPSDGSDWEYTISCPH